MKTSQKPDLTQFSLRFGENASNKIILPFAHFCQACAGELRRFCCDLGQPYAKFSCFVKKLTRYVEFRCSAVILRSL